MRKIFIYLIAALLIPLTAVAQSPAGRLPKTIVADVLAQMPAKNVEQYNQLMNDLVASGTEGLTMLTDGVSPSGDNTAVSYAIGGLVRYVTTTGKDADRQAVQKAIIAALDKASDREIKAFYIRQLEVIGDNNALQTLMKYAKTKDLAQEAVSAIQAIGTHGANEAIESIFTEIPVKAVAATAAANMGLSSQESVLLSWLGSSDVNLQKATLYALSKVGSEKSIAVIRKAAADAGYAFEPTNALESYLTILKRYPNIKEIEKLLKNNDKNVRSAAIQILAPVKGKEVLPYVVKAMADPAREYRNTALQAASAYADDAFYKAITSVKNKDNSVNIDIVNFLGKQKASSQIDYIITALGSADKELYTAAAIALGQINDPRGAKALFDILCNAEDNGKVTAVIQALEWYPSNINKDLVAALSSASAKNQNAVLSLIAKRRVTEAFDMVIGNEKFLAALPQISTPDKFELLCSKMENGNQEYAIKSLEALMEVVKQIPAAKALEMIKTRMQKAGTSKVGGYYMLLIPVGTPEAFAIVTQGVDKGESVAVGAAIGWRGKESLPLKLKMYNDPSFASFKEQILAASLYVINNNEYNDVQRLTHLRALLNKTQDSKLINKILEAIGKCNTFNALIVASEYLSNSATEQAAGGAVMNIALKDKNYKFWGEDTKAALQKFLAVRKGGDAGYEKTAVEKYINEAPSCKGFTRIFNGKDLSEWKGLVQNPIARQKMTPAELAKAQAKADEIMKTEWRAVDGELQFTGKGENICTEKPYGNFEMYVDWRIGKHGDSGIYLRGSPQVQIWDTTLTRVGAEVGSGGLYNNQQNPSKPLVLADNAIGDWNTFYIKMVDERVTVYLNGVLVVDNVILENYWDRKQPIFPLEQIELQAHGDAIAFRDIYVKELPATEKFTLSAQEQKEGFKVLFDGTSMSQWIGNTKDYVTENGTITLYPGNGGGGNLYTKDEYADFEFRFEFMLTPAANNGLGIRTPLQGDAAYVGTELQILDNEHPVYKDLEEYQYHGSAYGIIPAKRGFLKPVGEWNYQEVVVKGSHVKVTLNGTVILDGDMAQASKNGTVDHKDHPGLKNTKGHIGFLGHGSLVRFKNIRIKEL